jgi:hypothetical protein
MIMYTSEGLKISLGVLVGREGVVQRVRDESFLVLFVFRQQHFLILLRVVETIVFEFYMLEQGALRPVFAVAVT